MKELYFSQSRNERLFNIFLIFIVFILIIIYVLLLRNLGRNNIFYIVLYFAVVFILMVYIYNNLKHKLIEENEEYYESRRRIKR